MTKRISDTLSNLVKLNHGEYSKYQLFSSKIDTIHVYMLFFEDKSILNGPRLDTLSDLIKVNHGEYSKYQLC